MVSNTVYILQSLYSQIIFIINKQHHYIVFLPENKFGNAIYIKNIYTLSSLAWPQYVVCPV